MTDASATTAAAPGIVLLPSDRFFVRRVTLASDVPAATQVALALENLAPFPVELLYQGHVLAGDGGSALVFAAYRKRFPAEESAQWQAAAAVFPAFLALLGDPPLTPTIRVWSAGAHLTALAWDGTGSLPVAVLSRELEQTPAAADRAALVEEIRARTGLGAAAVKEFSGPASGTHHPARDTFTLAVGTPSSQQTFLLTRAQADQADVRDKEFLAEQRTTLRRDLLLWRGFLACVIGLAALLVLEIAVAAGGVGLGKLRAALREHAADVQRIETARTLSARIEELTEKRLLPFEMLAVANENRPGSIQFMRSNSTGLYTLEIQATTSNAADISQYESQLRASPSIESVETRDLRARDNVTNFTLTVTFKPSALHPETG